MQVDDERGTGRPQREGEVPGHTVRVARVGEEVAGDERPGVEAGGERLDCAGTGSWSQELSVISLTSSGTSSPPSSFTIVARLA
jgi:hypothetical protein